MLKLIIMEQRALFLTYQMIRNSEIHGMVLMQVVLSRLVRVDIENLPTSNFPTQCCTFSYFSLSLSLIPLLHF